MFRVQASVPPEQVVRGASRSANLLSHSSRCAWGSRSVTKCLRWPSLVAQDHRQERGIDAQPFFVVNES